MEGVSVRHRGAIGGLVMLIALVYETVLGIRRAGADAVLTYFAIELARILAAGGHAE